MAFKLLNNILCYISQYSQFKNTIDYYNKYADKHPINYLLIICLRCFYWSHILNGCIISVISFLCNVSLVWTYPVTDNDEDKVTYELAELEEIVARYFMNIEENTEV